MKKLSYDRLFREFNRILLELSFSEKKAALCAKIFTDNTLDGVNSHGINRFPVFVDYIKNGIVRPAVEPEKVAQNGLLENWNGHSGAGMYNASFCMDRAIQLAKINGVGCVTLYNNNHWMRGGTYGWQAADAGCIGICFTNATAGMPAWGGKEPKLGNNPLVIAVPRKEGHVVLDMAFSQFSYGKMQEYQLDNKSLPFPGGYDEYGQLTRNPEIIRELKSALPIGFWKGSGLALLLDILLSALTGGQSTAKIAAQERETNVSQCFLCFYQKDFHPALVEDIIRDLKASTPKNKNEEVRFPGERTWQTRKRNLKQGITVNEAIWNKIKKM